MRATVIEGPRDIRVTDVPDPRVQQPTDAVVRVTAACICGSDLWPYRGLAERVPGQRIGHEFVGVVEDVGADVQVLRRGDPVVAPFVWADGTCAHCRNGVYTSCPNGGAWGDVGSDGGQGEALRVPYADATLVKVPPGLDEDELTPRVLALSDVMGTGHHAALAAGVRRESTVAVVGDGAVGLCGVLAAARLGAERIVVMGRHEDRTTIARRFGATDVVAARGEEGIDAVRALTGGIGADAVLECVGTQQAMETAIAATRDGGTVGYVGVPIEVEPVDLRTLFSRNVAIRGGVAPVRHYLPELLDDVLDGRIDPSPVFDLTLSLEQTPEGYAAMDERRAIKVLIRP